jgi:exodeoxyribonuclease VII large subunit
VIIVGRGGGSVEDLWAFNEEIVARAIAAAPVPIVSAVGHEVDVTIADFVADLRAPTPSAAAEIVVAATQEFCNRIDRLSGRLRAAARSHLQRRRTSVHVVSSRRGLALFPARIAMKARYTSDLAHQLRRTAQDMVGQRRRRERTVRQRLDVRDPTRRLALLRTRLGVAQERITGAAAFGRHRAEARFRALVGRLESLSPLAVLARGYAVCWNAGKTAILRDAGSVARGDAVRITLSRGELACTVEETTESS